MRYFEFINDTSNKFWEIHDYWNADIKYIETIYGKIGSSGRTNIIKYENLLDGSKLIEKLISQKIKKGYIEKTKPTPKKTTRKPTPKKTTRKPTPKKSSTKKSSTKKPSPPKKSSTKKPSHTKPTKKPSPPKKECPSGKVRNPKTGRCIKKPASPKKSPPKKECPPGKVRNPKTGRCIKNPASPKKPAPKKPAPKKTCKVPPSPKPTTSSNTLPSFGPCKSGNDGLQVYDVGKKGVMLAHVFKDDNGKIKTAPKGFPQAPNGWLLSEKFDGYRAVWDGKDFRSRNNNIFETPKWFKDWLPASIALDGELFLGRESFEKCGLFRRKIPNDEEWKHANVKYQIFDSPSIKGNFEERLKELEKIIKEKCKCIKTGEKCPLILAKQTKVKNEEDVMKIYGKLLKQGAEGVMLRSPKSPYEPKRSSHLLKVKPHFDEECKIIGYKEGTGKYLGKLGAFKCELIKDSKIKFDTSGMNDEIRENYKTTHPIGTIITFVHMGIMKSGVPRHPNYLRKRLSE